MATQKKKMKKKTEIEHEFGKDCVPSNVCAGIDFNLIGQ